MAKAHGATPTVSLRPACFDHLHGPLASFAHERFKSGLLRLVYTFQNRGVSTGKEKIAIAWKLRRCGY